MALLRAINAVERVEMGGELWVGGGSSAISSNTLSIELMVLFIAARSPPTGPAK